MEEKTELTDEQKFAELVNKEVKDINWNIKYHEEKLLYYRMKLKMLNRFKI